jgi:uncharacterized membrane protein HdeD (DUF308 family)
MKEFLQRTKMVTVMMSIVMVILGILLIVNPDTAVLTVCQIVGCILLLTGIVLIIMYLTRKGKENSSAWDVAMCVLGVVLLALGIFVIIRPSAVLNFVGLLFAVILFLHAFYEFREMRNLKRMQDERWWISLICAAATLVMAILMLFLPVAVAAFATVLAGIFLIYNGVADLFLAFRVMQAAKRWEETGGFIEGEIIDVDSEDIEE